MKKILIVEDDIELSKELKLLLEQNGYQAEAISNFSNTKQQILESNSDLVLLDINIPNENGEYLLKEIRKVSNVPIIMVTSRNTELDEVVSMSYGADDYITKPYNPTILLLHIEALFKRIEKNSPRLRYRHIQLNLEKGTIETENEEITLSKNELMIFTYLLKNQGKIVTREDIMNYLWDTEEFIDDNTLTVNINRLRKRLLDVGLGDCIETRRGQGYILL
jgi:hypothetical protein